VDETYVKVNGVWRYVYRATDQYGQVIDVLVSVRRDADAARRFFRRALATLKVTPTEVVTDAVAVYPGVLDELLPSAWHHVEQYANNPIEADHGQLKHRLCPMRRLRTDRQRRWSLPGTLHAEPPARPLRARSRRPVCQPDGRNLYRTRSGDRTSGQTGFNTSADQTTQQRRSTSPALAHHSATLTF